MSKVAGRDAMIQREHRTKQTHTHKHTHTHTYVTTEVDVVHMEVLVGELHFLDGQQRTVLQIQAVPHLGVCSFADQMPFLPLNLVALTTISKQKNNDNLSAISLPA